MKKGAKLPVSIATPHPLLGAIVEFTDTWQDGWPKKTGLVTDVVGNRSLIIAFGYRTIIVPIETVLVIRTVLQGSIWLYRTFGDDNEWSNVDGAT